MKISGDNKSLNIQLALSDVPLFGPLLPMYWSCTMTETRRENRGSVKMFCSLLQSNDKYQDNHYLINFSYPSYELTINVITDFHGFAKVDNAEPLCYGDQGATYGQVDLVLAVKHAYSHLEICYSRIWQWDPGIMKLVLIHPIWSSWQFKYNWRKVLLLRDQQEAGCPCYFNQQFRLSRFGARPLWDPGGQFYIGLRTSLILRG